MSAVEEIRRIAPDDVIPAPVLQDLLLQALRHTALIDVLIERMAFLAQRSRLDTHRLSAALPELIGEVFDAATNEDWMAIADALIEDTREALLGEVEP